MMYDEEYFFEPDKLGSVFAEFEDKIKETIKQEFKDELERLKEENDELREFRDNKEDYERNLRWAKREYESKLETAKYEIKTAKLKELLGGYMTVGWGVKDDYKLPPKCDKCDSDRRIHFKSPSGRELTESCSCNNRIHNYVPEEYELVKFSQHKHERWKPARYYRSCAREDSDYDTYDSSSEIYEEGIPFEKVNRWRVIFFDKAKCEEYCAWLNEREK